MIWSTIYITTVCALTVGGFGQLECCIWTDVLDVIWNIDIAYVDKRNIAHQRNALFLPLFLIVDNKSEALAFRTCQR